MTFDAILAQVLDLPQHHTPGTRGHAHALQPPPRNSWINGGM
jgi:hypothetical protein